MDILILGNGFDLAHGLKTKYSDFLDYYKSNHQIINNVWMQYFIEPKKVIGDKWFDLEEEIYEVIKCVDKQLNIVRDWKKCDSELKVCCNFITQLSNEEIKSWTTNLNIFKDIWDNSGNPLNPHHSNTNKNPYQLSILQKLNFKRIEQSHDLFNCKIPFDTGYTLIPYITDTIYIRQCIFDNCFGLINFLYDELRIFLEKFHAYLCQKVVQEFEKLKSDNDNEENKHLSKSDSKTNILRHKFNLPCDQGLKILNFNYTNTFEELYDTNKDTNSKIEYIYVHGKLNQNLREKQDDDNIRNSDINLIFGTDSFLYKEDDDSKESSIDVNFSIFQKHDQRHYYGTINEYQELLKSLKKENNNTSFTFHILGHSLDQSDHNILKFTLLPNTDHKINIYYHDRKTLKRLVRNITKILGEEDVIRRVHFIKQDDLTYGILI